MTVTGRWQTEWELDGASLPYNKLEDNYVCLSVLCAEQDTTATHKNFESIEAKGSDYADKVAKFYVTEEVLVKNNVQTKIENSEQYLQCVQTMAPALAVGSFDELRTLQDNCSTEEKRRWLGLKCGKNAQDVWVSPCRTFVLPESMLIPMARFLHRQCHQGRDGMIGLFNKYWYNPSFRRIATSICESCAVNQELNVGKRVNTIASSTGKSIGPFTRIQCDFMELPAENRLCYALVIVYLFS